MEICSLPSKWQLWLVVKTGSCMDMSPLLLNVLPGSAQFSCHLPPAAYHILTLALFKKWNQWTIRFSWMKRAAVVCDFCLHEKRLPTLFPLVCLHCIFLIVPNSWGYVWWLPFHSFTWLSLIFHQLYLHVCDMVSAVGYQWVFMEHSLFSAFVCAVSKDDWCLPMNILGNCLLG